MREIASSFPRRARNDRAKGLLSKKERCTHIDERKQIGENELTAGEAEWT